MSSILDRVINNLRRPIPDLYVYLTSKVTSKIWSMYIKKVGDSFHISRGARIEGGQCVTVGDNFTAGPYLWIAAVRSHAGYNFEPSITIGSNVSCSGFVHIAATTSVTIHDGVLIGSRVHITDHAHGTYTGDAQDAPIGLPVYRRLSVGDSVFVGANVWLGDGVVVLPGVNIGEGTIVGANSVVSRSLPANVIAVGAPAVPIKTFDFEKKSWHPIKK
jgi:acetyltransferase-like isoleucine patch superfamily enzyme